MQRKRIVKVPTPEGMSISDVLVVVCQSLTVNVVMQRGIDPNEAFNEWEANKEQILSSVSVLTEILKAHGELLDTLLVALPEGVGMAGYRVDDLDFLGKNDGLPF